MTTGLLAAEIVEPFRLEADAWSRMRAGLALLKPGREIDLDSYRPALRRTLVTSLDGRSVAFGDLGYAPLDTSSEAERAAYRSGIRAWTLVWEAMQRPDCADFRGLDAEWLAH